MPLDEPLRFDKTSRLNYFSALCLFLTAIQIFSDNKQAAFLCRAPPQPQQLVILAGGHGEVFKKNLNRQHDLGCRGNGRARGTRIPYLGLLCTDTSHHHLNPTIHQGCTMRPPELTPPPLPSSPRHPSSHPSSLPLDCSFMMFPGSIVRLLLCL